MPKYTCFLHPIKDYSDKDLTDICPSCGRQYGFPLNCIPQISGYTDIKAIDRGFYSATYVGVSNTLGIKDTIKVSSKIVYEYFSKDFARECRDHAQLAENTQHVVDIKDAREASLDYDGTIIPCYIAILRYIPGETLRNIINRSKILPTERIAQICIDLMTILEEFRLKKRSHNDLHEGNLLVEDLPRDSRRADALDSTIRVVAIDLGSMYDESLSNDDNDRLGDIGWIAKHLLSFVSLILEDPDRTSQQDYRLASCLEERARFLMSRPPLRIETTFTQYREDIETAFISRQSPWADVPALHRLNDYYNAQALVPWYVPHLLVDPDNVWMQNISAPGPQIVTGMRGCGKTMLLKALDFHARAAILNSESNINVLERIEKDRYVGLYVSATRLLQDVGRETDEVCSPFERLYLAYAIETIDAVRHLQYIDKNLVVPGWHRILARSISSFLDPTISEVADSDYQLEREIIIRLHSLSTGSSQLSFTDHPAEIFKQLAVSIKSLSSIWHNKQVLFLLDDASTRYLSANSIRILLSSLLYHDPECAFKITSEAQTINLGLLSPGLIEQARIGRDYAVFDLGAEVYKKIREKKSSGGAAFVEDVLSKRAQYYTGDERYKRIRPSALLGDMPLVAIARIIVTTESDTSSKRHPYAGISALAKVCVGDIGDVITLYEEILRRAAGCNTPVPKNIQSECFQDYCSDKLYDLKRRKGRLREFALSFADAAHEMLVRSYKDILHGDNTRRELRQYCSIYIQIMQDEDESIYKMIRELIDAGVFIYAGGSPRVKKANMDPIQQFQLVYRKLYGLSSFIPLAERDRFELSGASLRNWLDNPSDGKKILMGNVSLDPPNIEEELEEQAESGPFEEQIATDTIGPLLKRRTDDRQMELQFVSPRIPRVRKIELEELRNLHFEWLAIGLGFEDRALESARRVLNVAKADNALLVNYPLEGFGQEIRSMVEKSGIEIVNCEYSKMKGDNPPSYGGLMAIDVSGLAMPAIFHLVKNGLYGRRKVYIIHTRAKTYYPKDEDVTSILDAKNEKEHYKMLEALEIVLNGERGPYEIVPLLKKTNGEGRRRVLCAFASPKHERILSLVDARQYDALDVFVPSSDSPRARIGRIVGKIAARNFAGAELNKIDSDDLNIAVERLAAKYQHWYINHGFEVEFGLTGSKHQAIAVAATSAAYKIAQVLYPCPATFDADRFTTGFGRTSVYEISIGGDPDISQ